MKQRNYTLAAFEFQDIARDYLGIELPSLSTLDEVVGKSPPEVVQTKINEPKALSPPEPLRPPIQLARAPSEKNNTLEGQIIDFLQQAGFWETVQKNRDFHFKILNEPYIPLVIERLGNDLCFTHYLSQHGDIYIDTEMVFTFQKNDRLKFKEVAVPNALQGGELRGHDRAFAKIFAKNIVAQGFVEAAQAQFQVQAKEIEAVEPQLKKAITPQITEPSLKEVADEVRDADLEGVAVELGLERDPHDKHKWRDGDHIISINEQLFMDWLADHGGRGAIDLVMHVRDCEFKEAVEWLSGRKFSRPETAPRQREPQAPRPLVMPTVNEKRWLAVQNYLVETRKLPAALVEKLHEKRLIYGDDFQTAVFVRHAMVNGQWQRGEAIGASMRSTWQQEHPFRGMAPGTVRNKGWFWLGTGRGTVKRVLLTESPIDTMSLAVLDKEKRTQNGATIYLSVDGAGAVPVEALRAVVQRGGQVAIAFDADKPGELMAWRVAMQIPGAVRLLPNAGNDWNDQLVGNQPSTAQPEILATLWQWHSAAFKLGHSEKYLNRIGEIAISVNKGETLSGRASIAMKRDLNTSEANRSIYCDCSH